MCEYWATTLKTIIIFDTNILNFFKMQKFRTKVKTCKLGPKMPYLCIFGRKFWKKYICNQHPHICKKAKFRAKKKNPETWDQKCLMYFLSTNLKAIIIFEINTL